MPRARIDQLIGPPVAPAAKENTMLARKYGFWFVVAAGLTLSSAAAQEREQNRPTEQAEGRGPATIAGCPAEPARFYACAKEKIKAFTPPRTADGTPDFQGYWNANRQAFNIEAHEASFAYQGGPTLIVDPADGQVPYQPWAAAKQAERADKTLDPPSIEFLDPNAQCFLRGVPRQMWMMDYQFVQPPGSAFIFTLHEQNHAYRVIPMDGRPALGSGIRKWMGDSRGRWEGNTLVITSANFTNKTWFDIVGSFHTEAFRLTERLTPVGANRIDYQATVEDPKAYTRPWTLATTLARIAEKDFEIIEEACHEGEKSAGDILTRPGR
jgi:hypothetical protein